MARRGLVFGLVASLALHGVGVAAMGSTGAREGSSSPGVVLLPLELVDLPGDGTAAPPGPTARLPERRPVAPPSLRPPQAPARLPAVEGEVASLPARPAEPAASQDASSGGATTGEPAGGKKKPRISPRYAAMLDGWFSARLPLGGLDLPWEEIQGLQVRVSIQIGPDRRVTSFSVVGGSGHGGYDARVHAALQGVVSSGALLPEPPDGEEIPPSVTLLFRCRSQERCS